MIFVTIVAVSMDAYVAGISVSRYECIKERMLVYMAAYSLVLPILSIALASAFSSFIWLNVISASIIIIMGLRGILTVGDNSPTLIRPGGKQFGYVDATLLGASLSVDTSVGAAALSAESFAVAVPFFTFAAHYILLSLGRKTAKLFGASQIISQLASAAMIILGVIRLIG